MKQHLGQRSIQRATKTTLAAHKANFSLDGLKYHFNKLKLYTNPTGGALDKIPMNTKAHTAAYYAQFEEFPANKLYGPAPWQEQQKAKPIFLRKKAQYQVADHLLGIGKRAYWTGSTGPSTLVGLDIDDHESDIAEVVQANSDEALQLFVEMTGLIPVPCKSPGGINAFLICHKIGTTTHFVNEIWHAVVRLVNAEARRKHLMATLECKGKARIFNKKQEYCGVQFKDPLYNLNPTDEQLHAFWDTLESKPVTGPQLLQLVQNLEVEKYCVDLAESEMPSSPSRSKASADDLLPEYRGHWAKQCREWAIHGLPCDNSIATVVAELAKWLYFVEMWEIDHDDRSQQVAALLFEFCQLKHNGHITRLTLGQEADVEAQIHRIVESEIVRLSDVGKSIFAKIQAQPHMKLLPLMRSISSNASFSSVKSTECCAVSGWLPAPEYWRQKATQAIYVPDDSPLPEVLKQAIAKFYKRTKRGIYKPTWAILQRFLNYLWTHPGHEGRLGIESLEKMGFSNSRSRRHIAHLKEMGVIDTQGYCRVAGVSTLYRLRPAAVRMFTEN